MSFEFRLKGFATTKDHQISRILSQMNFGELEYISRERDNFWYIHFSSRTPTGDQLVKELQQSPKKLIYGEWPNGSPKFWWIYKMYRDPKKFSLANECLSVQLEVLAFLRRDSSKDPEPTLVGEAEDYTDDNGQEMIRQRLSNGAYLLTPK